MLGWYLDDHCTYVETEVCLFTFVSDKCLRLFVQLFLLHETIFAHKEMWPGFGGLKKYQFLEKKSFCCVLGFTVTNVTRPVINKIQDFKSFNISFQEDPM